MRRIACRWLAWPWLRLAFIFNSQGLGWPESGIGLGWFLTLLWLEWIWSCLGLAEVWLYSCLGFDMGF